MTQRTGVSKSKLFIRKRHYVKHGFLACYALLFSDNILPILESKLRVYAD